MTLYVLVYFSVLEMPYSVGFQKWYGTTLSATIYIINFIQVRRVILF